MKRSTVLSLRVLLLLSFLAPLPQAQVLLTGDAATRDPEWKKESGWQGCAAWHIHISSTLYKITNAEMSWSFPGPSGEYKLSEVGVYAKTNGSAPFKVIVAGVTIYSGSTPLPSGMSKPKCCGANNNSGCSITTKDVCVNLNPDKTVRITTGAKVVFWGETRYYCQPSGWQSGQHLSGYGGGTYCGFTHLKFTPVGGTITPTPPKLNLSTTTLKFTAVEGAASPSAQSVSASNGGGGTLPVLSASDNATWLAVKVEGTGNTQKIVNTVNSQGLKAGILSAQVTVKGSGLTDASYTVSLQVSAGAVQKPLVTLLYPNGGETLTVGQTIVLKWQSDTSEVNLVDLSLSADGGKTWHMINPKASIDYKSPEWGKYSWKIPEKLGTLTVAGSNFRVRVTDYLDGSNHDMSDNSFSIAAAPATSFIAVTPSRERGGPGSLSIAWPGEYEVELYALGGKRVHHFRHRGPQVFDFRGIGREGLYWLRVKGEDGEMSKVLYNPLR